MRAIQSPLLEADDADESGEDVDMAEASGGMRGGGRMKDEG
jgi:hypothetical protein